MKFDGCRWRHEFVPYQSVDRTSNLACAVHLMNVMFHYVQPEKVIYTRQSRNGRRGSTELLLLLLVLNTLFLFYTLFVFMPLLRSQLPLHSVDCNQKKRNAYAVVRFQKFILGAKEFVTVVPQPRMMYANANTNVITQKKISQKEYNHFQTVGADDTTRSIPFDE